MIRALVFDFDGLIVDTEYPVIQSWEVIYQDFGVQLPFEQWLTCVGTAYSAHTFDPYAYLEAQLGHPVDRLDIHRRRHPRYLEMVAQQPVRPGIMAYLEEAQARGLHLGVASSSNRKWVTGNLSRLHLADYFQTVHTADDVTNVKPDPELYQAALTALDVTAPEAIALEDSVNGVVAAQAAGLFCVAVPNALTRHLDLSMADMQVETLAALPLEKLLQICS